MTNLTEGQVNKIVETAVAALKNDIATMWPIHVNCLRITNQLKEKSDRLDKVEKENNYFKLLETQYFTQYLSLQGR